jgi:hypothetical protein
MLAAQPLSARSGHVLDLRTESGETPGGRAPVAAKFQNDLMQERRGCPFSQSPTAAV